jgi:DNA-binding MarR family transcriptional regulator
MSSNAKYGLHDSLGYWVHRLASEMQDAFDRAASDLDVTASQWAVLIALHNGDAHTPGVLARFIGIHGAAITRLLDRLEEKALVLRSTHASDRRAVTIALTEKGRQLTPQVAAMSQAENQRFLDRLTDKQQVEFRKLLQKIVSA